MKPLPLPPEVLNFKPYHWALAAVILIMLILAPFKVFTLIGLSNQTAFKYAIIAYIMVAVAYFTLK